MTSSPEDGAMNEVRAGYLRRPRFRYTERFVFEALPYILTVEDFLAGFKKRSKPKRIHARSSK